jgi:hypothetical protein
MLERTRPRPGEGRQRARRIPPMMRAAKAHARLAAGHVLGKIVLRIG